MATALYWLGTMLFLAGIAETAKAAATENKTEKTEFRVIAICLMLIGIGIMVAVSTAKTLGLF